MTLRTALIIAEDPEVYASAYGPIHGKFGIYIGTLDESPSGSKRPRDLLTSEPIYETADAAKAAGQAIIDQARKPISTA